MKPFAILLALSLLAGTQAFVLRDEPDTKIAQLSQRFREHLVNLRRTVGEKVDLILGVEFVDQLTQNVTNYYLQVRESLYNLEQTLPAETKQVYDLALRTPWGMWSKALDSLNEQRKKLSSATEEMSETLPGILKPYVDPVLKSVAPYTENLGNVVSATVVELKAKMNKTLTERVEDLASQLNPYATEVQNHWKELRMSFSNNTEPLKEELLRGLETINNSLVKTFVTPFLEIFPARTEH
ncbi:PREDICTED: apolipoprotein A-I-1-like [Gekko japonicus]|uniref:Apolipoprotein A-I-1-like n=1 Tax=Gekko japonicus TaxID=146911 RepID=A0ABM1L3Y5_GEKJA|nr:PREDICTED: apolipoprotein A-I-1-like [Gekko japonicus]